MEFSFGFIQTSGHKCSASWIRLLFFCSMLSTWTSVQGWSYFHSSTFMTWEEARTWCRDHYTDMVAIQNQEEIEHLKSWLNFTTGYYWIGIRKLNDTWTWVGTNKALTPEATNWAKGEPNNGKARGSSGNSEDCVEMYIKRDKEEGKWNDESCLKKKTALCYSAACKSDSCQYGECVETINSHECACNPGFYGDKCDQVVTCNKDEVRAPDNGKVTCTHKYGDFAFDSSCQYSCKEGFQLSMAGPQRCTATGSWSEQPPTCQLVQCPTLTRPSRGSMKCNDPLGSSSYRSTCAFACNEGYVLDGSPSNTLQCESSGSWNASQPSCVAVQCPAIQALENGIVRREADESFSYGKTCTFSCAPGYKLVGPNGVTCTSTAEWSEQMPHCEAVTCQIPKGKAHLTHQCSNSELRPNSSCSFSCDHGFKLQGAHTTRCSEDGQWSEDIPACKAVQCPAIQDLGNGIVSCEGDADERFSYGKTCSFSCAPGYKLVGPNRVSCTSAAEWSEKTPHCEAITCKTPEGGAHLFTDCSEPLSKLLINSTCSFTCEPGFELQGVQTVKCSDDGRWSEDIPSCKAVRCLVLEDPESGSVNCSNAEPLFNTQCTFTCGEDSILKGDKIRTCDHHGNWTGDQPTCEAVSPSATVVASSVAAGGAAVTSGLALALWLLKRLRKKASKFELDSNSNIDTPTAVYKSSIDSLI
ncbi:E-selectin-like isoform X1 [Cololabis saira]|uniref:E-selectin-like isoform X1 n=1 Tax=Cololabis saira TaxID=129043 RepID=UPI002AD41323|nr:E-selectin-like isoform X1 [Cololabis saira]